MNGLRSKHNLDPDNDPKPGTGKLEEETGRKRWGPVIEVQTENVIGAQGLGRDDTERKHNAPYSSAGRNRLGKSTVILIETLLLGSAGPQVHGLYNMTRRADGNRKPRGNTERQRTNGDKDQRATPAASIGAWIFGKYHPAVNQLIPIVENIPHERHQLRDYTRNEGKTSNATKRLSARDPGWRSGLPLRRAPLIPASREHKPVPLQPAPPSEPRS